MRTCRVCGCTDSNPCIGCYGETCSWAESDLCSFCPDFVYPSSGEPTGMVELYTEAEASQYIREMRGAL